MYDYLFFFSFWLRNKNTIEFLGIWERLNNPNFNLVEFDLIRMDAGTNRFLMSVNQWVEKTNAIGVMAKAGRYGGTYKAIKDYKIKVHYLIPHGRDSLLNNIRH